MSRIGFLGYGKIGSFIANELEKMGGHDISFIQDPFCTLENSAVPVVAKADSELLEQTDLVIESATSQVLKDNMEEILKHANLMIFSVTAFADEAFAKEVRALCQAYGREIYLPHGAIAGVDGIVDGKELIHAVSIETIKSPKSLGLEDMERTVVFDGCTREACALFPRNVNVHATIAIAGLGFDQTKSRIIADPAVTTNTHKIHVEGEGIDFQYEISSFATGGVTGKYTPYSAISSVKRVLKGVGYLNFV